MKRSRLGAILNYTRKTVKNLKIPGIRFTNPDKVDPEPATEISFSDGFINIKCPLCKEVYQVAPYTDDFVCNSRSDGEGCRSNRFKYFDHETGQYKEEYRPFYFEVS